MELLSRISLFAHIGISQHGLLLAVTLSLKSVKKFPKIFRNDFPILNVRHLWILRERRIDAGLSTLLLLATPFYGRVVLLLSVGRLVAGRHDIPRRIVRFGPIQVDVLHFRLPLKIVLMGVSASATAAYISGRLD